MKKIAATLLALAPAAPAVACDHAPLGLATGYAVAVPQCACPDPADAFAATSVQTYSAPVVTLAPVVQSYQSATVALPTVTHSYAFGSSSHNAFSSSHSSSHNAFGVAAGDGYTVISANRAFNRGVAAGRHDAATANRAFNRGLAAGRRDARQAARRPARRGILGRILGR